MKLFALLAAIGIVASVAPLTSPAQDHGHLNIGSSGTAQDDPLIFDESFIFDTNSGYVKTLNYTNGGTYAGYYQGNITLTVLAATPPHGGPVPNAPALGSWIFAQISSVQGPAGGSFAFWNTGATSPTISVPSGGASTSLWQVSESDGSPGADPYGHFHGRRFTATKRGVYVVGFRAFDLSTNGAAGGPIHTPAAELQIYFQAGVNIKSIAADSNSASVVLGAPLNTTWQMEARDSLNLGTWTNVGDPITGNDQFVEVIDSQPPGTTRFYRARRVP